MQEDFKPSGDISFIGLKPLQLGITSNRFIELLKEMNSSLESKVKSSH